ncbi:cysteine desulfurase family protein [Croceitalea marina]|uniref:cysteine desulfurase n=1 Tax=Croceitalea marina TaxID=1775166 RepID=A0ABW5MS18_9FLAO
MNKEVTALVYLDNSSTTPIDSKVLETMMPFLKEQYANASSNHGFGHQAKDAIKKSREQIGSLVGSEQHEIIFTSGATEAINLAIKGVLESYQSKGKHIITVKTEHSAVLDVCLFLETKGFEITYLGVDREGLIDLQELRNALREDTILVSVMLANNETGVIQPIKKIADLTHKTGALFMTDATQAFGKIPIDVDTVGIDIMAFSGHKIYGPKGIGGLFVRQRRPNKVKLVPLIHGGGHERGMRSGTSNVPGIVGLGMAAEIAARDMEKDKEAIEKLRNELEEELLKIPDTKLNGNKINRLYNICSVCFSGADADAIMMGLKSIIVSNGSACTSTKIEPSHVLIAMGLSEQEAYSTIRFSLGRFTNREEIKTTIEKVRSVVEELRAMST